MSDMHWERGRLEPEHNSSTRAHRATRGHRAALGSWILMGQRVALGAWIEREWR